MGATKSEEFLVKDNRVAKYAKALSHPARVAILKLLIQLKRKLDSRKRNEKNYQALES